MLGVRRASVSLVAGTLQKAGLSLGGHIHLVDMPANAEERDRTATWRLSGRGRRGLVLRATAKPEADEHYIERHGSARING